MELKKNQENEHAPFELFARGSIFFHCTLFRLYLLSEQVGQKTLYQ